MILESPAPRVLVLLAAHNGERWLEAQLSSILAQRGVRLTLLVGDDASVDGTAALVADLQRRDDRVHLRRFEIPSGSAGANYRRLFRLASLEGCDFVAFADQDDIWDSNKLAEAITALDREAADGYSCAVTPFDTAGRRAVVRQVPRTRAADFLFEGAGQGCTFLLRVDLFRRVQRFCLEHAALADALHYHDWLTYLLARSWGARWHFDPHPWMLYRQHGGNEIGARGGWSAVMARLGKIRNHWYRSQIRAAAQAADAARPGSPVVARVLSWQGDSRGVWGRLPFAWFTLRHGRRRFADRVVLAVAALAGWI